MSGSKVDRGITIEDNGCHEEKSAYCGVTDESQNYR